MLSDRQIFTHYFFDFLKDKPYVLLKYISPSFDKIDPGSDLDILLDKKHWDQEIPALLLHPCIEKYKTKRQHNLLQWFLFFVDDSFLQIDFLPGFVRKSFIYLDAELVLNESYLNQESLQVPSDEHFLEHVVLFNFLNHSGVPEKYIKYWKDFNSIKQEDLIETFNQKYGTAIKSMNDFRHFDNKLAQVLKGKISQMPQNRFGNRFFHQLIYLGDLVKRWDHSPGMTITFSGVDGAGKTTIMGDIERILSDKYRQRVVRLRHRPSLLPILSSYRYGKKAAEERASQKMPRQGKNQSKIGSIARFAYYYLDYIIGQLYVYWRFLHKGNIVLYDRYYFDFIVDGKRSNICLDSKLSKWLYRFIHHPHLNVFLYASPELILKRKQELEAGDIEHLTHAYKNLFSQLSAKSNGKPIYAIIENVDRQKTIDTIMDYYKELQ